MFCFKTLFASICGFVDFSNLGTGGVNGVDLQVSARCSRRDSLRELSFLL